MANETILVVDDEELLRNAIVFQFKREGFNVLSPQMVKKLLRLLKLIKLMLLFQTSKCLAEMGSIF